jgi:hypothetical protein
MTPRRELASLKSLPIDFGMVYEPMKCPTCGENTPGEPRIFQTFLTDRDSFPRQPEPSAEDSPQGLHITNDSDVQVTWMRCANEVCRDVVVWINESTTTYGNHPIRHHHTETWIARPRGSGVVPNVDPLVKPELAQDYREAYLTLEVSPRLAVIMARSILEDLLRDAGYPGYLTGQIKKCLDDPAQPLAVKQLLEPLRVLGDWGAHPFKDPQNQTRIPVERALIEWALATITRLFEHFVVTPERDRLAIEAVHKLNDDAARNAMQNPNP